MTFDDFLFDNDYEPYKSSKIWEDIYAFLKRGIWHVTSRANWELIQSDGFIGRNLNGRYTMRFDTTSERSYGVKNELICLFDFETPTEDEVIRMWGRVWDVMIYQQGSILIALRRAALVDKLLPNTTCYWEGLQHGGGCVPFCEAWYPDDIPTKFIDQVYELPPSNSVCEFIPKKMDARSEKERNDERDFKLER